MIFTGDQFLKLKYQTNLEFSAYSRDSVQHERRKLNTND